MLNSFFKFAYLVSHDEFHRVGIAAKFTRKIFTITFFKILVHGIFPQLTQHLAQVFTMRLRVIDALNLPSPN